MIYLFIVLMLFALTGAILDIYITNVGIKKGVAVEGNDVIVALFGDKPTLKQSIIYWSILYTTLISIGAIGLIYNQNISFIDSGVFIVLGIKHIIAYREWKRLGA